MRHHILSLDSMSPQWQLCEHLLKEFGGEAFYVDHPYISPELWWREENNHSVGSELMVIAIRSYVKGWMAANQNSK
jgi:hypothetical protein